MKKKTKEKTVHDKNELAKQFFIRLLADFAFKVFDNFYNHWL